MMNIDKGNTWWWGVPALIAEKGRPWTYIAEKG